jgi:uncharacterized protein DUF6069
MAQQRRISTAITSALGAVGSGFVVGIIVYYIALAALVPCDPQSSSTEACPNDMAAFVFATVAGGLIATAAMILIGRRRGHGSAFWGSCAVVFLLLTLVWINFWFT